MSSDARRRQPPAQLSLGVPSAPTPNAGGSRTGDGASFAAGHTSHLQEVDDSDHHHKQRGNAALRDLWRRHRAGCPLLNSNPRRSRQRNPHPGNSEAFTRRANLVNFAVSFHFAIFAKNSRHAMISKRDPTGGGGFSWAGWLKLGEGGGEAELEKKNIQKQKYFGHAPHKCHLRISSPLLSTTTTFTQSNHRRN